MSASRANLQHQPFLTPIWLTALAAVAAFAVALLCIWIWFTANSTTVVVIRHAEKESVAASDPPLSAAGQARADLLAKMFGYGEGAGRHSGVAHRLVPIAVLMSLGTRCTDPPADS